MRVRERDEREREVEEENDSPSLVGGRDWERGWVLLTGYLLLSLLSLLTDAVAIWIS